MLLTRREFLGATRGAAAAAVLAGLGLSSPRRAYAITGVDDAVLGAVVVAMLALGGYSLYDQYSSNLSLQAVGKSFGDYVSVSDNRLAAAQAAAAIAATYGVTSTQQRYETAAQSIADGTGAFADAMAQAASTGRLALDGLVSGAGDLVGAMRELVAGYVASGVMSDDAPMTVPGLTTFGENQVTLPVSVGVMDPYAMGIRVGVNSLPINPTCAVLRIDRRYATLGYGTAVGWLLLFTSPLKTVTDGGAGALNGQLMSNSQYYSNELRYDSNNGFSGRGWNSRYGYTFTTFSTEDVYFSPGMLRGGQLPVVDRPVDAPDVIGAGWDSVPLATDMVISPTTGGIAGAGSVPLPTGIPSTAGDYAAALQGALAGVVPGAIALPTSLSIPVTVATPTGIATMPISEAISTDTSLQLDYAPDVPITPVLPPVEIPEGPWSSAVELPFNQLWPFNMIYSVVRLFQDLGSS